MRQQREHRRSRQSILTAAAIAAVAGAGNFFAPSTADATLMVDLRIAGVNGVPVTGDRKATSLNLGDTLTLNVVARVSGTNSVQTIGNFDNATPSTDTRNDDSIKVVRGSFQSIGSIKGNFQGGANANQGQGNTLLLWSEAGAQNGVESDFDSDGDLDLGAAGANPNSMWLARAGTEMIPTVGKRTSPAPQTRFGVTVAGATGAAAGFAAGEDVGGPITAVPDTRILDAKTAETLLGELTWIYTGGTGTVALNFVPYSDPNSGALWFEDGISTGKNAANSAFIVGPPVEIPDDIVHDLTWSPATAGGSTTWTNGTSNWVRAEYNNYPWAWKAGQSAIFTNAGVGAVNIDPAGVFVRQVSINNTSGTYTFSGGPIKSDFAVTISGGGTTVFTAPNEMHGATVSGGSTLIADGGDNRLGLPGFGVFLNNATIKTQTTGITSARNFFVSGTGGTFDTNGLNSSTTGALSGTGAFTKAGAGTLTLLNAGNSSGATNVIAGKLELGAGGGSNRMLRTGAVSVTGTGKIDLQDNKLIVTGVGATGTWNGSAYTGVAGLIDTGKGSSNAWDGATGIVTSQSTAVGSNYTTIGVAKASDVRSNTVSETALWASQTITGTDTLVMYTYAGDTTLDGKLNIDDYIRAGMGRAAGLSGWSNGDFNYDGRVNVDDYLIIDSNIVNQTGIFPTTGGMGDSVVAVPEPGGCFALSMGLGLLARWRRRRF